MIKEPWGLSGQGHTWRYVPVRRCCLANSTIYQIWTTLLKLCYFLAHSYPKCHMPAVLVICWVVVSTFDLILRHHTISPFTNPKAAKQCNASPCNCTHTFLYKHIPPLLTLLVTSFHAFQYQVAFTIGFAIVITACPHWFQACAWAIVWYLSHNFSLARPCSTNFFFGFQAQVAFFYLLVKIRGAWQQMCLAHKSCSIYFQSCIFFGPIPGSYPL